MPVGLKKKKNQVRSPSPESRVLETGSDPPIWLDRESGRDRSNMLTKCLPKEKLKAYRKRAGLVEPTT